MNPGRLFFTLKHTLLAVLTISLMAAPLSAQQDKQSQNGSAGKDSHIKSDSDQNNPNAPDAAANGQVPAPYATSAQATGRGRCWNLGRVTSAAAPFSGLDWRRSVPPCSSVS